MATIAHLANFVGPKSGGIRTCINEISRQYSYMGHITHVIVPSNREYETVSGSIVFHEVKSPLVPKLGGYRAIVRTKRVREILSGISPDAIELSDRTTLLSLAIWARHHDIPTTIVAHERIDGVLDSFAPNLGRVGISIADHINRRAAKNATTLVSTTKFAGREFDRINAKYVQIPLGVDLHTFNPQKASDAWRAQFDADVVVMLCSRLSKEKRPEFAIEVLDSLTKRGIKAHLVVAGAGPMEKSIASQLKYRPATMLGFLNGRESVARALASVDVVLAPGPIETFGLAALEALASGTPVIAHHSSAIPEVVGDAGLSLPLRADSWSRGVERIMCIPDRRSHARARAEQFTWNKTAEHFLRIHGIESPKRREEAA
jgi:alpha-1,6-mannosyltransferase